MEQLKFVDPPNRPMDTTYRAAHGPVLHKNLLFVDADTTGRLLVGSTNVCSTFWEGSIQVFNSYDTFKSNTLANYYNGFIIHDAKFLKKLDCVLLAESNNYLRMLNISNDSGDTKSLWRDCVEHYEDTKEISLWEDQTRALTVTDKFVTLWDVTCNSGMRKVAEYAEYHTDEITSASPKKSDTNIFASAGIDRRLCIWDTRTDSTASELYVNEFCSFKSISWSLCNDNIIAAGTEAGDIYLFDAAQPKEFLSVEHSLKYSIHKIVFSGSGDLAVCGNTTKVKIYNCRKSEFDLIYEDNSHTKFVRGLAWSGDRLYSCGFDSQIHKHTL